LANSQFVHHRTRHPLIFVEEWNKKGTQERKGNDMLILKELASLTALSLFFASFALIVHIL
jgi:hypothetical protein